MAVITELCKQYGPTLEKEAPWLDGECLLRAIAMNESAFGTYNVPKHEKAYDLGGVYGNKSLWAKYGAWAACSYSSWQIMYPTALELGFNGSPADLWRDGTAIYYVVELILRRGIRKGATTVDQLFDMYNSGSFKDGIIPQVYIDKGVLNYNKFKNEKIGTQA